MNSRNGSSSFCCRIRPIESVHNWKVPGALKIYKIVGDSLLTLNSVLNILKDRANVYR